MATFAATLGGHSIEILREAASLSDVPFANYIAKGHRSGVPRSMGVDMNDVRTLTCTIKVTAASKDALIAAIRSMNDHLLAGTTLVMAPTSATNSVTFNVLPSPPLAPDFSDPLFDVGLTTLVRVTLNLEPYAYGPETTLVNAVATTYPGVLDITVPGDFLAPLQLTFTGTGIHCLYVGLLPDQATALPLWEAESLTWAGGTTATEPSATAHGGNRKACSSGTSGASFADTPMPNGSYLPIVRVGGLANAVGTYRIFGNPATDVIIPAGAGGGLGTYAPFPVVRCPVKKSRNAAVSDFGIGMVATGTVAWWDYVGLCPATWGWAMWAGAAYNAVTTSLVFDYDGLIYSANYADAIVGKSGGLAAVGAQRLVVFADSYQGSGGNGTIQLTTTVKVVPRYALWA